MILSKEALLAEAAPATETVKLKAGDVIVRELDGEEYMKLYMGKEIQDEQGNHDPLKFASALVARCVMDADGNRMFTDEEAADLGKFGGRVFAKLSAAARRLNGLSGDEGN